MGTEEALATHTYLQVRGVVDLKGLDTAGVFTELLASDGRTFISTHLPGMTAFDQGAISDIFWEEDLRRGGRVRDEISGDAAKRKYGLLRHAPWSDLYLRAKVSGTDVVDGRMCFVLSMIPHLGLADRWFLDAENFRLLRSEVSLKGPANETIRFATTYGDWRTVDGVTYPFKRVIEAGESRMTRRVEALEHPSACAPSRFAPPLLVAGVKQPPGTLPRWRSCAPLKVLSVRTSCKPEEVGAHMSVSVRRVADRLAELDLKPIGPPFTRYHSLSTDLIEIESGMPVSNDTTVEAKGEVKLSSLPGGEILDIWHYGPIDTINRTYGILSTTLNEFGLERASGQWEVYWSPPGQEEKEGMSRTQVIIPVRRRPKTDEAEATDEPADKKQ
ncbi:MAG: GyrI-like domain-containing protein [Gammaproteobacteria bacterium]|nr:GyrI-like domain-containing protein [Gammaproteobacteria bacterium]